MELQLIDMSYLDLLTIRFVDIVNGGKRDVKRYNSENGA
jgi:hypothetical protein